MVLVELAIGRIGIYLFLEYCWLSSVTLAIRTISVNEEKGVEYVVKSCFIGLWNL
jgi:hypothetical protein